VLHTESTADLCHFCFAYQVPQPAVVYAAELTAWTTAFWNLSTEAYVHSQVVEHAGLQPHDILTRSDDSGSTPSGTASVIRVTRTAPLLGLIVRPWLRE